ncbi:MAG: DNA polymerase III subunit beta [Myxococcota bacterium]
MRITLRVPDMAKALQRVQGIVEKKTTMPILANALLESTGDGQLRVSATDLEIGLTGVYPAEVEGEGGMTLGAKALYDIVRSLPEAEVTLEQAANQSIEVRCGKVNYRLNGLSADAFPALPRFEDVPFFPLDAKSFSEMLEKTLYAVSTDETRYNLTGVYCERTGEGQGLRMVATDGHRLAMVERPTDVEPAMSEGVIIPRKGLQELRKILDEGDLPGRLGFVENSAVFEKGSLLLTMRLVDGRFPDYQQVLPKEGELTRSMKASRAAFMQALKRVSLLAPDKAQGVQLELKENVLALRANNPDMGDAVEELDVDYTGEPLKIGFNYRYLLDILNSLKADEVVLQLKDEMNPGVLHAAGADDHSAVVMPMRM